MDPSSQTEGLKKAEYFNLIVSPLSVKKNVQPERFTYALDACIILIVDILYYLKKSNVLMLNPLGPHYALNNHFTS